MAETYQYQGFWIRLCAYTIDSIIFSSIAYLLGKGILFWSMNPWYQSLVLLAGIIAISAVYETIMVGRFGGTIGKLLLRMRIISDTGTMNYKVAFVRWASTILSTILLMIGYLMIAWDPRKQALHDRIAKTLVIRDDKSRVPVWASVLSIIGACLIVISYLTFTVMVFVTAITAAFQAETRPLDTLDPTSDLESRCDYLIGSQHDLCLQAYQEDSALAPRTAAQAEAWCARMRTSNARAQCYGQLAAERRDPAICDTLPLFQKLACRQQYGMISSVVELFLPTARNITGELVGAELRAGLNVEGTCIPVQEPTYGPRQLPCFIIVSVPGFELASDGTHKYAIDARVWRSDGALLAASPDIQSKEPVKLLDGTLKDRQVTWNSSGLPPGAYTYELTVYDQVSKKGVQRNWTINLQEEDVPDQLDTLPVRETFIGTDLDDTTCVRSDTMFFDDETACFVVDVGGLVIGEDDLHRFEMSLKTRTADGSMYDSNPSVFGDDGHIFLRDNATGKTRYIITRLSEFPPGAYEQEITVQDLVGHGRRTVKHNFTVTARPEPREALTISKLKIGIQDGDWCEGTWDQFTYGTSFSGLLCAEPYAAGLVEDEEGNVHFEMNLKIVNADGTRIVDERNLWDGEGMGYLEGGYLFDYAVHVPVADLQTGEYQLTLTLYDTLANTKGTATRAFSVE